MQYYTPQPIIPLGTSPGDKALCERLRLYGGFSTLDLVQAQAIADDGKIHDVDPWLLVPALTGTPRLRAARRIFLRAAGTLLTPDGYPTTTDPGTLFATYKHPRSLLDLGDDKLAEATRRDMKVPASVDGYSFENGRCTAGYTPDDERIFATVDPWRVIPALTKNPRRRTTYGLHLTLPDGFTYTPTGWITAEGEVVDITKEEAA